MGKDINEYDEILDNEKTERGYKLRSSFLAARDNNPDEYANIYNISKKTNLPMDIVERNKDQVVKKYEYEKNDYDALLEKTPKTADFLSTPDNAKLAKDDIKSLMSIEETLSKHKQALIDDVRYNELVDRGQVLKQSGDIKEQNRSSLSMALEAVKSGYIGNITTDRIKKSFETGATTIKLGSLGFDAMILGDDEAREAEIANLQEFMVQNSVEAEGVLDSVVLGTANIAPQILKQGIKSAIGGAVGGVAGGILPFVSAKSGAKWGAKATSIQEAMQIEGGNMYLELRDVRDVNGDKIDPALVKTMAMGAGAVNAGLELVQLDILAKNIPGLGKLTGLNELFAKYVKKSMQNLEFRSQFVKAMGGTLVDTTLETSVEMLQNASTFLFTSWAKDLSSGYFEDDGKTVVDALTEDFGQTYASMLGVVGGSRVVGSGISRLQNKAKVGEVADLVQSSKLYERGLDDKAEEFIKKNLEQTDMAEAFVPAEDYVELFQNDAELGSKLIEEAGLTKEFQEALEVGGRVAIPTEKLATMLYRLKNTDYGLMLQRRVTFDINELTIEEAQKFNQGDKLKENMEKIVQQSSEVQMTVYDEVMKKLVESGYGRGNAEPVALLYQNFADNMKIRKADDGTWFEKLGLDIKNMANPPKEKARGLIERIFNKNKNEAISPKDSFFVDLDKLRNSRLMKKNEDIGMSLAQFLRYHGGLKDVGGNLKAIDAGKEIVGLINNKKGLNLDDAMLMAWENGYFSEFAERPDINVLLEAISDELGGNIKRYNKQKIDMNETERLNVLASELDKAGVDLELDNNEIIKKLEEYQQAFEATPVVGDILSDEDASALLGDSFNQDFYFQNDEAYKDGEADINSEAFKSWFGDSKVVDENGEPLVVYHGTNADFDTFDKKKIGNATDYGMYGRGFYFSNSDKNSYGNRQMKLYLSIENPFLWNQYSKDELSDVLEISDRWLAENQGRVRLTAAGSQIFNISGILKEKGYDGVINVMTDVWTEYVVFEPTQIKSAENQGAFDSNNPNIYYQDKSPKIEIKGDELGDINDKKEFQRNAIKYFKETYQGHIFAHPKLGSIRISGKGIKEFKQAIADVRKLQVLPKLQEIIETALVERSENINKVRNDGIIKFHYLSNQTLIKGVPFDVFVTIGEDRKGNLFYNLNEDNKNPQGGLHEQTQGLEGLEDEKSSYYQSIAENDDGVNIEIVPLDQNPRGSVLFGENKTIVNLFKNANLSTMLHETGHIFLESMKKFALKENAPEATKRDWQKIKDYLEIGEDGVITKEAHEKFARSFEAYFMEGKAPSVELRSAFSRFKRWLTDIYINIRRLNVPINDEIRGVFDRMLATDEAIVEAEKKYNLEAMFGEKPKVMSDSEWRKYIEVKDKARTDAFYKLRRDIMSDIEKERSAEHKKRKEELLPQVENMVAEMSVYQVLDYITKGVMPNGKKLDGPRKLNRQILIDTYGADIEKLPQNIYKIDGMDPEAVFEMFGFESVEAMIAEISAAPDKNVLVSQTLQDMLDKEFKEYASYEEIRKAAELAILSEHQLDLMLIEDTALRRHYKNKIKLDKEAIKAKAEEIIENSKVPQIQRSGFYKMALDRATNKVYDYAMKGQYELAAKANYQRILNSVLLAKATSATKEIDAVVKYLDGFNKNSIRANVDKSFLDQIDAILERFDLRKDITQKEIGRRKSFGEWKTEQEAIGNIVDVDTSLMTNWNLVHYKDMTYNELMSLRDSIKNIHHLAKLKNKLLSEKEARDFDYVVNDMVSSIGAVEAKPKDLSEEINPSKMTKLKKFVAKMNAEHLKAEFITRALDNYRDGGSVWENVFNRMAKAENYELKELGFINEELNKIYAKYDKKEKSSWGKKVFVEALGMKLNKLSLFAIALNMGNEQNKKALLEGYGWKETKVNQVLNDDRYFTEKDWETVQQIWDMLENTMWDKIKDVTERVTGIAPQKVNPQKVITKWRSFKGGYYPLQYDPSINNKTFDRTEKQGQVDLLENQYMKAATKKGHTKARTSSGGQAVKIQMDVLSTHIKNAVHDYTHREALIDVQKLLANDKLQTAIVNKVGIEQYRQLKPWLQGIANDFSESNSFWETIVGKARANATIVAMGWKVTTAIVQPLGLLTSADVLQQSYGVEGNRELIKSINWFYKNPLKWKEKAELVFEKSVMLRNRSKSFDRDVRDYFKKSNLEEKSKISDSFFYLTSMFDMGVAIPTWEAAYNLKFKELGFKNEQKAIDYADMVVRTSQSSGGAKDLAAIQRGSELKKMFTMFYSFFSVLYNRFAEVKGYQKKHKDMPKLVASLVYLWFAPAVLGELIAGRGPDDEEEWLKWAGKEMFAYPFQAIVGIRDIVNAIKDDYGYKMTPVSDALASIPKLYNQLTKDEIEGDKLLKSGLDVVGYWMGLPTKQINITAGNFFNWLVGEDDDYSLKDVFFYKKS